MIAVINYGMGNIRSVVKAIEYLGHEVIVTDQPSDLIRADRLILPGVGAFGTAMSSLKSLGLDQALTEQVIGNKKPFLGICLGLQLVATTGYEFGEHAGLGWVKGRVCKLVGESRGLKIPHVGWNQITVAKDSVLFAGVKPSSDFYFVHSYQFIPVDPGVVIATTTYGEIVTAAIQFKNIFATQFHPEKSQDNGLKILSNFIDWQP